MSFGEAIYKLGSTFLSLFKESVVIQAAVTLLLIIVMCVLILRNDEVPEVLILALGTVMGFWFKTKQSQQQTEAIKSIAGQIVKAQSEDC